MSNLKALLNEVNAEDVRAAFKRLYDEDHTLDWVQSVLDDLRQREPVAMPPELIDDELRTMVCLQVKVDAGDVDVSGVDDAGMEWALSFTPWAQWLGLTVSVKGSELTPADMVCHILWEMTWHGTEQDAQKAADEIRAGIKEAKAMLGIEEDEH